MTTKKILVVLIVLTFHIQFAYAQSQEKIYSVMMINFAKGMEWPQHASKGNFVIGVLEYPPLASELLQLSANIKLNGRKIEVVEFANADEVNHCHMLFIPAYKAKRFPDVISKIGTGATLLITNKMDYAKKGAGINFVLVDGKLRYEINTATIEKRGLKVSSDLKRMGIAVQ